MVPDLNVSLIQTDLYWENTDANLSHFEEILEKIPGETDLVILPEMFNTGFSMDVSEPMNFSTHKWMKNMASKHQSYILGSLAIKEGDAKYNRALLVNPDGKTYKYDKKHLFGYGKEIETFTAGNDNVTIYEKGWKIKPLICYDLRFPVWCRNTFPHYDVLVFVASWPKARINAWKQLLIARAIENQCFVIGVNRIGTDGNGLVYNGQSIVIDFQGEIIADGGDAETVISAQLKHQELQDFRKKFPFLNDMDSFHF